MVLATISILAATHSSVYYLTSAESCFSVQFRYHEGLTVDSNMVNKLGHIPACVKQLFSHIVNTGDFS